MKKQRILKLTILFAAFFAVTAGVSDAKAQMTGAYGTVSTSSRDVRRAANFAIASRRANVRPKLVRIVKAEQQVVAGLNYRICMDVRRRRHTERVTAVVYRDLRGRYSMTSWDLGRCERGGPGPR